VSADPASYPLLLYKARKKLQSGALPDEPELRLTVFPGFDEPCALCDLPISSSDLEYDVEVQQKTGHRTFRFHVLCRAAWRVERGPPETHLT
jgi:hypothetical protein